MFRLFSSDIGLLTSAYPAETKIELISQNGEVKSGKSYKSHKALTNYMEVPDYHLERAYVFSTFNVEKDGEVIYLPIYMSYLLKEPKINRLIIDLDMTGL